MTSSGRSRSTASSSSSTDRPRRILLAAGCLLAAGGIALVVASSPEPDPPPAATGIPLARKLLILRLGDVPDEVAEWRDLTPFHHEVRERGRGGPLIDAHRTGDLAAAAARAEIPIFGNPDGRAPEGETEDLSASDAAALAVPGAFGRFRSCIVDLRLDSIGRAVERHGRRLRTATSSASATALAIRALDQRCFEASRAAGSDAVVVLIREYISGDRAYVTGGQGLRVAADDIAMSRRDLDAMLAAVLGLEVEGSTENGSWIDGVELTEAEARAHLEAVARVRAWQDAADDAEARRVILRIAAIVAAAMGAFVAVRAGANRTGPAQGPDGSHSS